MKKIQNEEMQLLVGGQTDARSPTVLCKDWLQDLLFLRLAD
jgi:hypothetical protein